MDSIAQPYGVVYFIHNTISNRVYVGKTVNPDKRWKDHVAALRYNEHWNRHLQRAWNKYGARAFEFVIAEAASSENELNELERFYIEYLRYCGALLYNITEGGAGGFSPAAREQARMVSIGRGKTEQEKARWRAANAERMASEEYRQFISAMFKGKKKAQYTITETVQAKWEAQRGKKEAPEKTTKRIGAQVAKQPLRYFQAPDGTIYSTRNVKELARQHGLHPRLLNYVAQGKQAHHRGWVRVSGKEGPE